jgi:hypothetical protein
MLLDGGLEDGGDEGFVEDADFAVALADGEVGAAIFDDLIAGFGFFPAGEEAFFGEEGDEVGEAVFEGGVFKFRPVDGDDLLDDATKEVGDGAVGKVGFEFVEEAAAEANVFLGEEFLSFFAEAVDVVGTADFAADGFSHEEAVGMEHVEVVADGDGGDIGRAGQIVHSGLALLFDGAQDNVACIRFAVVCYRFHK